MTPEQKVAIRCLREYGLGYKAIGIKLNLSINTIKSFCRREAIKAGDKTDDELPDYCYACGRVLKHIDGKKKKRFCSTSCRQTWWNDHLDEVHRKAYSEHICLTCGISFMSYANPKRKYCSHRCYVTARFGEKR
ncbi:TPA: RNA polymerase subunit sigma-70 [Streptococcus suis]